MTVPHPMHRLPRPLFQSLLWLAMLFLAGCAALQQEATPQQETPQAVQASPNDHRQYRYIRLDNELQVLLVSDPSTDKAAAALDVRVGSRQDPDDRQGLAHFLEHMLFLGTAKYPEPGEYQSFITQHGGSHNAYTAYESTNYFFDIQPDFLEPALDRFAQQFISPLFSLEYVDREKNAVHSEFTSGLKDDNRRFYSALKSVINPEHPFSNFSVGNLETLSDREGQAVRDRMLDFYQRYYSANLMSLVIYGKQDLDSLERLAREKFSAIPNRNRTVDPVQVPIVKSGTLPSLLTVEPVMEQRILRLMFPLPPVKPHYQAKPDYYISHLLGHEGEGSLLSWLKSQGWADALASGLALSNDQESVLSLSITLTQEGLRHYLDVTRAVFAYIDLVRRDGIEQWRFDEQARLLDIAFRFQERSEPIHFASYLASQLQQFPPEEVIRAPYRMDRYAPELYRDFLGLLTPDNVLITLVAKGVETDRNSPWYDAPYGFRRLTAEELARITRATSSQAEFRLPEPNPFIPERLEMVAGNAMAKPERLSVHEHLEAWYARDPSFGTPRANFYLSVRSPNANASPRDAVLTELYVRLAEDALTEFAYDASLAGLDYRIYKHIRGFTLRMEGFSDKQKVLLEAILKTLKELQPTPERFNLAYDNLRRRLENASKYRPYERAMGEVRKLLLEPYWTEEEQLEALRGIGLADLKAFMPRLLDSIYTVTLAHGNLTADQARELNRLVSRYIVEPARFEPVPRSQVVRLGENGHWYRPFQQEHHDTGYVWMFQGPSQDYRTRAQYGLMAQLISAPYYQEIRTQRQLGYIVFATPFSLLEVPGLGFIVQSPNSGPEQLYDATRQFLREFDAQLKALPVEAFEQYRQSLRANLLERPKTLTEKSERYWIEIDQQNFEFDTRERIAEELAQLRHRDMVDFYQRALLNAASSLMIFNRGQGSASSEAPVRIEERFKEVPDKSTLIRSNGVFTQTMEADVVQAP